MKVGVALLVALILAGTASAAGSSRDIVSAMKALHYPKPGAIKLGCHGAGAGFNCKATYRNHRVRRFYAKWQGEGGWVCAGKPTACRLLVHGWVKGPLDDVHLAGAAELAAVGVMQNRYHVPQPFVYAPCSKAGFTSWQCGYKGASGPVTVTVSFKAVKGGYIVSATSSS